MALFNRFCFRKGCGVGVILQVIQALIASARKFIEHIYCA